MVLARCGLRRDGEPHSPFLLFLGPGFAGSEDFRGTKELGECRVAHGDDDSLRAAIDLMDRAAGRMRTVALHGIGEGIPRHQLAAYGSGERIPVEEPDRESQ